MSLYVEVGFPATPRWTWPPPGRGRWRTLRAEGLVEDHRLVAEHSVLMNPAYVHLTSRSMAEARRPGAAGRPGRPQHRPLRGLDLLQHRGQPRGPRAGGLIRP